MTEKRPIILVTGANGGVGFGVCHRLLVQLAQDSPADASPKVQKAPVTTGSPDLSPYLPVTGATLILGCRNQKRAEVARAELLQLLDNEVARQKSKGLDARHAETFQKNLDIAIVNLDLSSVENVFACAADIRKRFPYITHMVFNAGVGSFAGINWPLAVYELCTRFKTAMTAPGFKIQAKGQMSEDGLGWVWQCNVFGHYILARALRDMLARNPYNDARIMWMSSLEGRPSFFPGLDDWQLVKASHSYEASKYQTQLLACTLDQLEARNGDPIRHLVVHPGVAGTNIFIEHTGWLLDKLMFVAFYLARWFGSPHHVIQPYKAAISAVHIALVSLAILPSLPRSANTKERSGQPPSGTTEDSTTRESDYQPVHYGAETNFFGTEYVGVQPVEEWEEHKEDGRELLARCDRLYEGFENKMQL